MYRNFKIGLFLYLLFTGTFVTATNTADSLVVELEKAKNSEERILVLHELVWELSYRNNEKALEYASEALELSVKNGNPQYIATSYNRLGLVYDCVGNFYKAEKLYLQSLEMREKLGDKEEIAGVLNNLGGVYYYQGKLNKSFEYYASTLRIQEAMDTTKNSVKQAISRSYNNMAMVLKSQNNYRKAGEFYSYSIRIKKELNDTIGLITTYGNLGVVLLEEDKEEEAEAYFNHALELAEIKESLSSISDILNNIGILYNRREAWQSAEETYLKVADIKQKTGDRHGEGTAYINLASIYNQIGKTDKGYFYAMKALEISKETGYLEMKKIAYQLLSESVQSSDPKTALEYYKRFNEISDSLLNKDLHRQINELAIQYESEKKEAQIELLAADKKIAVAENERKNAVIAKNESLQIILIVAIALLIVLAYFIIRYYKSKKEAAEERSRKQFEQYQREVDKLRNSIKNRVDKTSRIEVGISQSELNRYLLNPLTERELEVLYLIADGLSNKIIAEKLFVSVNTIKTHLLRIYEKLDVRNRTQATVKAGSMKIIPHQKQA